MKALLSALFLFFTLTAFAQAPSDTASKIEWTPQYKLVWADFRQAPDSTNPFDAHTFWNIAYSCQYINNVLSIDMHCTFDRTQSMVKKGKKTDYLLSHEQGHFDIAEIFRRRFCKILQDTILYSKNLQTTIQGIFDRIFKETDNMQNLYDKETNHSKIVLKQEEWKKKIASDLNGSSQYSASILKLTLH